MGFARRVISKEDQYTIPSEQYENLCKYLNEFMVPIIEDKIVGSGGEFKDGRTSVHFIPKHGAAAKTEYSHTNYKDDNQEFFLTSIEVFAEDDDTASKLLESIMNEAF